MLISLLLVGHLTGAISYRREPITSNILGKRSDCSVREFNNTKETVHFLKLFKILSLKRIKFNRSKMKNRTKKQTRDFITHKIRSPHCYDAHNRPDKEGPTRVAVSLFISDVDSVSEKTMAWIYF